MHGGNLLAAVEKYGRASFIDLSANINPFGPPPGVPQAIAAAMDKIVHYPDPDYRRLRKVMAEKYSVLREQIILGNGAGELLFSLLYAIKPQKVLIPVPGFSEYGRAAWACGAECKYLVLGEKGWDSPWLDPFQKAIEERDLVFINSPHNPTGSQIDRSDFEGILEKAKALDCWVIMDESFVDFLPEEKAWSARAYLDQYPKLIVLYSLTKFYAIPGLRLGAVFAAPDLLLRVQEQRDPWAVNIFAEEAGIVALQDEYFSMRVRRLNQESRTYFYQEFQDCRLTAFELLPSTANFALIRINRGTSQDVVERLGKKGILVRDCANFQGLDAPFIRVAIKDIPSMQSLLEALVGIDAELKGGVKEY